MENDRIEQAEQKVTAEKSAKAREQILIAACLEGAEADYWNYMEINGTKNEENGNIRALNSFWDTAKKDKQVAIDNCYRQYE